MYKEELWQVYAPNGEPIPGEGWDSALGNPEANGADVIIGIAIVFLYRLNDEGELEFLWQKRADGVDRYPGYYDISAGGHINLGESVIEAAIREADEEIGAKIEAEDLQFAFIKSFNRNRFAWVYMVDYTGKEEDFKFNDGEVSEVRWVPYAEIDEFWHNFTKPPLRKDELTLINLADWLRMHGYLQTK